MTAALGAEEAAGAARRRGRRALGLAAGGYLAAAVLLFAHTWLAPGPGSRLAGSGNDPGMFAWYMGWTPWALGHGYDPLLTDHLAYPEGANLMWNTSVVLPALLLWPVTATLGPVTAYDVLATLGPALSALVAFALLRRHAGTVAAAAGAALYGFGPAVTGHTLGQPMLTLAVLPPLALLLVEDGLAAAGRRGRLRAGALLGVAATVQLLTGAELLAIAAVSGAVALGVAALVWRDAVRRLARPLAVVLGTAVATFLVTACLPLAVLLLGPQRMSAPVQPHDKFVQDLVGLVVPGPTQAVAPLGSASLYDRFTGNSIESSGYVGIPLLALALAAAWWGRRRPLTRWAAMTAAALAVLSLGPSLHVLGHVTAVPLPWRALQDLPLLENLLPARFSIPCALALALLVAAGTEPLLQAARRRRSTALAMAAGLGLVAVSLVPLPVPATALETPPFFTTPALDAIPEGAVVAVVPYADPVQAMVWQAQAGMRFRMPTGRVFVPMPNPPFTGYLGPPPSPLGEAMASLEGSGRVPALDGAERQALLGDLHRLGVSLILVGPCPVHAQAVAMFASLLGTVPVDGGGVTLLRVSP